MDKKMKRQVTYDRKKHSAPEVKPVPVAAKVKKQEKPTPEKAEVTTQQVISWLTDHPGFKWGWMCDQIGINKGNFGVMKKSEDPKIKPEIVLKIVSVIKDYGFNPTNH